ncbi:MAG: hypothetical protein FWC60_04255 [Firmicutes bacterium]|nr:hypothetical protein [Bacillota bacterium]
MQANAAVWEQIYDEICDEYDEIASEAASVKLDQGENTFVGKVQRWLEGEDSPLALLMAYGLCGLAALYFLGRVIHSFAA